MSLGWTDERVELLKKLWVEGLSAAQIANRLGGVTRNAVIGKVHRLGLAGRNAPSSPTRRVPSAPVPRAAAAAPRAASRPVTQTVAKPAVVAPVVAPVVAAPLAFTRRPAPRPEGKLIDVHGLSHGMCKWPIGDPGDPDFGFCGSKCETGAVYCTEHAAIAYTQPMSRKERQEEKVAADSRRMQRSASI